MGKLCGFDLLKLEDGFYSDSPSCVCSLSVEFNDKLNIELQKVSDQVRFFFEIIAYFYFSADRKRSSIELDGHSYSNVPMFSHGECSEVYPSESATIQPYYFSQVSTALSNIFSMTASTFNEEFPSLGLLSHSRVTENSNDTYQNDHPQHNTEQISSFTI